MNKIQHTLTINGADSEKVNLIDDFFVAVICPAEFVVE